MNAVLLLQLAVKREVEPKKEKDVELCFFFFALAIWLRKGIEEDPGLFLLKHI